MALEGLADLDKLGKYLKHNLPELGVKQVESVSRFPGGLSSLSCRIDLTTADLGAETIVLRAEPEHGVIPPYDIVGEFALLRRMGEAGLPVPGALRVESDTSLLGTRFMLMTYIEGEAYRSADPRFAADPDLEKHIGERFVEMLARIHMLGPVDELPNHPDAEAAARDLVAVCRKRLADTEILPQPLLVHALDVLDRTAPGGDNVTVLHGDFRLPNLKWRDGEIVGILDWELARIGDPLSDIAFTQTVGAGPCAINGELLERYRELTGIDIDEFKISYYQLLELVKGTIIGLAAASDLVSGGTDLRLLSVAGLAESGIPIIGMLTQQLETMEGA